MDACCDYDVLDMGRHSGDDVRTRPQYVTWKTDNANELVLLCKV